MPVSKDTNTHAKELAGITAAKLIQPDMLVGLGTGSTATHFIRALSQRCRDGLQIRCVATSTGSWDLGNSLGLPMIDIQGITNVDITVDGADEIDPAKNMIKGGGGALLREKILASMSREMVVVVDEHKLVERLGNFPLPVEVEPYGFDATVERIGRIGFKGKQRIKVSGDKYVTDGGHYIIDLDLKKASMSPAQIDSILRALPGVIETGFFFGLAGRVIVGNNDGTIGIL